MSSIDFARMFTPVPGRESPSRPRLRTLALAGLILLTSVAVGATTSFWLVPPYLLAMGWLLLTPSTSSNVARTPFESSAHSDPVVPAEVPLDSAPEPPLVPAPVPKPRKRKPRASAKVEPTVPIVRVEATWIQVAPGSFVRVEKPIDQSDESTRVVEAANPPSHEEAPNEDPAVNLGSAKTFLTIESGDEGEISGPIDSSPEMSREESSEMPAECVSVVPNEDSIRGSLERSTPIVTSECDRDVDDGFRREEWLEIDVVAAGPPPGEDFDHGRSTLSAASPPPRDQRSSRRSTRVLRDRRPAQRRGNGRVGAKPRVSLSRC